MTDGFHPKVALPALVLALAGAALLVVGAIVHDSTLTVAGGSLLAASGVTGGVGYVAPAGSVTTNVGPPSDELLPDDVRKAIDEHPIPPQ